ncbi:ATP-binding cassette domain-containing protein [Levilactobacillus spicheri]|uniref:ABC transporter domain-containing protein n=2 Tax=Levilactobacillus spicheri TaxID=216463 RepID=A0A0F3RRF4_9LACO|nr:ABC transporter ATP-binding protein [Levilactobacillus spicheri]KJW12470.1 hypothetical protein VC81_08230 [Levilactobacillus spicheri]KRL48731.1 ABC transporter, ATP-binding protein [Levilactobacillus spicheri DSM 15429]GEO66408.1 hypothetical protein LSP04_08270 [Levilactobacillus spicheri]
MINSVILNNVAKDVKNYHILQPIDLTIPVGSVWGLTGPNGSGKTTLLKLITGFMRPSSGSITILGTELSKKEPFAPNTGFFFKEYGPLPNHSALGNMLAVSRLHKRNIKKAALEQLLSDVELDAANVTHVKSFSTGMQQKLLLAMSLINEPRLLIWDEPDSALDVVSRKNLLHLITKQKQKGTTILVSSHNQELLASCADNMALLENSKVMPIERRHLK